MKLRQEALLWTLFLLVSHGFEENLLAILFGFLFASISRAFDKEQP